MLVDFTTNSIVNHIEETPVVGDFKNLWYRRLAFHWGQGAGSHKILVQPENLVPPTEELIWRRPPT